MTNSDQCESRLMLVHSAQLIEGAKQMRANGETSMPLQNGVGVTPAQLEAMAQILMDAEPSIITSASGGAPFDGRTIGQRQERPGFIDADDQPGRGSIHFRVGVLSTEKYRITRSGKAIELRYV